MPQQGWSKANVFCPAPAISHTEAATGQASAATPVNASQGSGPPTDACTSTGPVANPGDIYSPASNGIARTPCPWDKFRYKEYFCDSVFPDAIEAVHDYVQED